MFIISHWFQPFSVLIVLRTQRVTVPLVSYPDPYQRVPVSQTTPSKRVQKEFSVTKPLSATPPVQNNTTPKLEIKPKNQHHPMIVDVTRSVQESCDLECISMTRISKLVRKIILHTSRFYYSKLITLSTTKGKEKLLTHSSLALKKMSGRAHSAINSVI